jgi:hypothetical protein
MHEIRQNLFSGGRVGPESRRPQIDIYSGEPGVLHHFDDLQVRGIDNDLDVWAQQRRQDAQAVEDERFTEKRPDSFFGESCGVEASRDVDDSFHDYRRLRYPGWAGTGRSETGRLPREGISLKSKPPSRVTNEGLRQLPLRVL